MRNIIVAGFFFILAIFVACIRIAMEELQYVLLLGVTVRQCMEKGYTQYDCERICASVIAETHLELLHYPITDFIIPIGIAAIGVYFLIKHLLK